MLAYVQAFLEQALVSVACNTNKKLATMISTERGPIFATVDRQTKNSSTTSEAAQSTALTIKTGCPIVQVSVYDSVEHTHAIVQLPAASS
jgi:hypothetical protein